ncbi:hypothetical protein COY16_04710 [Candidatus Roizmanbacteria bacterium CG_4_10_14_0_2_um_filter_39_13]|uniref:Uncharacterized protein n=1 Tax=Candidatus Roizmanbacteria bacterium CG_4_10_14_0_2_um_filter_39_13 TaxID=1974825 RepID=A0A2M7TX22_9BACT|nr:MAG: hypothetical protein COY16_04710 [Candidatus Roizmanbacteria bacterium CG_4_10_14_0_2_um_filter_39_13]
MNKLVYLVTILVLLSIAALIFFIRNASTPTPTKIKKQGNTLEVPIDMITDGAPPDSAGGP